MATVTRTALTWIVAAAVAIGLAVAGVGLATSRVTPPPSTIELAVDDVQGDDPTDDPSEGAPTASDTATPTDASEEPSAIATSSPTSRPSDTASPSDRPTSDDRSEDDDPSERPSDDASERPSDDPSDRASESESASDAPTAGLDETRTAQSVGGTASFRFTDRDIEVLSVSPAQGFASEVERSGPFDVKVFFTSSDHESRIDAEVEDGEPRIRVREDDA